MYNIKPIITNVRTALHCAVHLKPVDLKEKHKYRAVILMYLFITTGGKK